jgi:hypothetical protein
VSESGPQRGAVPGVLMLITLVVGFFVWRGDIDLREWLPDIPDAPPGADAGGDDRRLPPPPPGDAGGITHDPEVARTICRVADDLGANDKVLLSAFEAALVESNMRNLDHGDRDSLGVFQQRPSQGWGTPEQVMNPDYAARQYISRAIRSDQDNPDLSPGLLAQSVQRSAFPERYDRREGDARVLIGEYCG